jgi:hypothetical protein
LYENPNKKGVRKLLARSGLQLSTPLKISNSEISIPQSPEKSTDSAKKVSEGKASRELDLDYDENIEASKTLTNRDILVNALESATTSQVERYCFTTKPPPITKSLSPSIECRERLSF